MNTLDSKGQIRPFSAKLKRRASGMLLGACALGSLLASAPVAHADYTVPSQMQWWSDARFGMFIHFGSYSHQEQGEWVMHWGNWSRPDYQNYISKPFNPVDFDAAEIVTAAKNAGMKYITITAKHHEGLAMWNRQAATSFKDYTGTTIYSLPAYTNSHFSRDLLMELKNECVAQGLKFCLYYSILDWGHASQVKRAEGPALTTMTSMQARADYIADMKRDLQELITRYDPSMLWFDGDWFAEPGSPTLADWWTGPDGQDLYNYVKSVKPSIIVNERVKRDLGLGDYAVAEFGDPPAPMNRPWERVDTMNGIWGYDAALENPSSYRPTQELVRQLVITASKEGNYMLNIGPDKTGNVTTLMHDRLSGIGAWTSVWGASIYGTTRSPFSSVPSWGTATKKDGFLYCHVFNYPTGGGTKQIAVPAITNAISNIYVLNNPGTSLSYTISGGNINITLPNTNPDPTGTDAVIAIACAGIPVAAPAPPPIANGTYKLTAKHSGKALFATGTTNGSAVQQKTATGASSFKWTLQNVGGNQYTIKSVASGRFLDVYGVSMADGANIVVWDGTGSNNQKWTIQSVGGGYYTLTAVHSGKAMDVYQASTANGASVLQWTLSGSPNQQWTIQP
jgi:alpha-L-fucosidase